MLLILLWCLQGKPTGEADPTKLGHEEGSMKQCKEVASYKNC